jgi:energy-coupling factor transport system permease protein
MPRVNVSNFMTNVDRESWVHRLDPRTKLLLIVFFASVPLFFTDIRISLFFIALTIPLWLTSNLDFKPMAAPLVGVGMFLCIIFLFNAIRGPAELTTLDPNNVYNWHVRLGPIVITSHTAERGLWMAMRLVTAMTIGLLVISTTDPTALAKGLLKLKMPASIVFMVLAGFRFVPIVTEQVYNILDAQTIRGVSSSRVERTKLLLLPLFVTSLRRVRSLGLATEAKGFGAQRWHDFYEEFALHRTDIAIMVLLGVLAVASIVIRFGFGFGGDNIYYGT